jgi:hypothetical protein
MIQRTVFAVWMVGPSAMGSVKGIPSSIISENVNWLFFGLAGLQLLHVRTSATSLHSQHNVGRLLRCGIACGHICNEGRLYSQSVRIFSLDTFELTLPSFLHCANVFLIASMTSFDGKE